MTMITLEVAKVHLLTRRPPWKYTIPLEAKAISVSGSKKHLHINNRHWRTMIWIRGIISSEEQDTRNHREMLICREANKTPMVTEKLVKATEWTSTIKPLNSMLQATSSNSNSKRSTQFGVVVTNRSNRTSHSMTSILLTDNKSNNFKGFHPARMLQTCPFLDREFRQETTRDRQLISHLWDYTTHLAERATSRSTE